MINRIKGLNRSALLAVAMVLTLTGSAAAALFFVYPPALPPLATRYNTHAANWWKWVISVPKDKNPLLDMTGANCGQGQSGLVFYLAGSFGDDPVTRNCTVPPGKHIIIPVMTAVYFAFAEDPAEERTEAFVRSQVEYIKDSTELELEIDGVPVQNVKGFFERSDLFSVTLPANNVFNLPAGFVLSPSADAGYYVGIAPLLGGQHTIHWHAKNSDGFTQDITYNLNVRWW